MSPRRTDEGDQAVADFESELYWIRASSSPFIERLARVGDAYRKASSPFNLSGDDRVLSKMRNSASELVGEMAKAEAVRIADGPGEPDAKRRAIERIKKESISVPWLPAGFRSSISAELALVASGIGAKG